MVTSETFLNDCPFEIFDQNRVTIGKKIGEGGNANVYQSEYREDAINEHKNIYGFSNLDLDDDEILNHVNTECELIKEGIEDHIVDDLPIYYFIDFYYIIQRSSGKEAQGLETYIETIFNYCNFSNEFEENWGSLEEREESYLKFNS